MDLTKQICHLTGHTVSQFQIFLFILGTKNQKLFSSVLGFKVIFQRSRNNESERCLFTI